MTSDQHKETSKELGTTLSAGEGDTVLQQVGILVADTTNQRLLESIAVTLELTPVFFDLDYTDIRRLCQLELIIADESVAQRLRPLLEAEQRVSEQVRPALVAVIPAPSKALSRPDAGKIYDAVLALPESVSLLSGQIGVALYAHRVYALRHQSSLNELSLNRTIFRSVTSGISIADAQAPDLPLLYVNPAFEAMTGYTSEEVTGKNCRFLQRDDRDQLGLTLIREAVAEERETVAILKNFRKDGSAFWNELTLSPIRDREGVLTHFIGIQLDVSERTGLETALRESEKLAAVGRLASVIAHEINNPLEAITNLVYLLGQTMPDIPEAEECNGYIRLLDQELRRIKLITSQSLRFSKQSHGPDAVRAEELINSIVEIYASRLSNYNVELHHRFRSCQSIVCLASELRQVLTNLITNASDAMQKYGRGNLLVRTREATRWADERKGVVITVADTGMGMSKATQSHLFKAFYSTKGARGTGLGLWVSSEIVARHHGSLRIRSSQDPSRHGTVFQFFLPYQAAFLTATGTDES